jgi:hypothetical protein
MGDNMDIEIKDLSARPGQVYAYATIAYFDLQPGVVIQNKDGSDLIVFEVIARDADTESVMLKVWDLGEAKPFKPLLEVGSYNDSVRFRGVLGQCYEYLTERPTDFNSREMAWSDLLATVGPTLI